MESGQPSRTALRVAMRRAAHQMLDRPCVLEDPFAEAILGPGFAVDPAREAHPMARAFRAFMAVRSRYVEDRLADAVVSGVTQYVVLGAGLDTFAWRNPFGALRVYEIDFPATQEWKRALVMRAGMAQPANLTFVPLDFEHRTLAEGLAGSGFESNVPAFFGWLGVVPYLTRETFDATIAAIAALPAGTAVAFDYALAPESLSPLRRLAFNALAARVAAAGEPFNLFFTPRALEERLQLAGFRRLEQVDSDGLNERYFNKRADGLKLPTPGLGIIATAWV